MSLPSKKSHFYSLNKKLEHVTFSISFWWTGRLFIKMKLLSELERLVKELSDSAFGRNPERFICNDRINKVQKSLKKNPKKVFMRWEINMGLYGSPSHSNACVASWKLWYKKKKKKKHFKKKSLKRMGLSPSIFLDQFIEKFPIWTASCTRLLSAAEGCREHHQPALGLLTVGLPT